MTYLSYQRTGPAGACPLLLLHALPLDSSMWDRVRAELADVDVLTVDAPGFGSSPSGAEIDQAFGADSPSLDTYARAIVADLEEMGIKRIVAAGLSMGGPVAMALADIAPEKIAALALLDTNIGADSNEARENRLKAAKKADGGDISSVLAMADTMTAQKTKDDRRQVYCKLKDRLACVKADSLAWIQRAMAARPDRRDQLSGPVLLVRGEEDASCSAEMMADLSERTGAEVRTIPNAGHFTALETPKRLARYLREFLAEIDAA